MPEIKLETSWKLRRGNEISADYMQRLSQFLRGENSAGKKI